MTRPVQFTRASAERIAAVVRAAELTPRPASPLEFDAILESRGGGVRICTFTGAWPLNTQKSVVFASGNTVSAMNLFSGIAIGCGSRKAAIAKDGTAWYLIAAQCE